jgi:hypothetical protein
MSVTGLYRQEPRSCSGSEAHADNNNPIQSASPRFSNPSKAVISHKSSINNYRVVGECYLHAAVQTHGCLVTDLRGGDTFGMPEQIW